MAAVEPKQEQQLLVFPSQYPDGENALVSSAILDCQFSSQVMASYEDQYFPFPNHMEFHGLRDISLYGSLDIVLNQQVSEKCTGCNLSHESGTCFFDELCPLFDTNKPLLLPYQDHNTTDVGENHEMIKFSDAVCDGDLHHFDDGERSSVDAAVVDHKSSMKYEIISQHFYLPISQASKKMNVGITLLKKRCRELGIQRWPRRKLMSLQALINNLKESEKVVSDEKKRKYRYAIEILEKEMKEVERWPDKPLGRQAKRLRQAFFKENYKKKQKKKVMDKGPSSSSFGDCMQLRSLQALFHDNNDQLSLEQLVFQSPP